MPGSGPYAVHRYEPTRHRPFNLVTPWPEGVYGNPNVDAALRYFRVTLEMVATYVLMQWSIIGACSDDIVYEECAEAISSGNSIFYVGDPEVEPQPQEKMEFFQYFEVIMDLIYGLRDNLRCVVDKAVNLEDECDATVLTCYGTQNDCMVIRVQPDYHKPW